MKQCKTCQETLPLDRFSPIKGNHYRATCKQCRVNLRKEVESVSIETRARSIITKVRYRATKTKLTFDLDPLWLVMQWYKQAGRCAYSSHPMTLLPGDFVISLDRVNSSHGYTKRNTVLCCFRVNIMKCAMTVDEFREWCRDIYQATPAKALPKKVQKPRRQE